MTRFHMKIEYDGTGLAGLQRQMGLPTVQDYVEKALFAFSGERVTLYVAGRTDAGVHALSMSTHFDLERQTRPHTIMMATNAHLETEQIRILSCEKVSDDFHARFDAKKRHYLYRILNRPGPPALMRERCWHIARKLDVKAMKQASETLIGHHDFTSFRASECQALGPHKTLDAIEFQISDDEILISFEARSFLHHMVRNIVGTLVDIGLHKNKMSMSEILNAKSRPQAGPTAPPNGLYFVKAEYEV